MGGLGDAVFYFTIQYDWVIGELDIPTFVANPDSSVLG
jgi:hypothetical protein